MSARRVVNRRQHVAHHLCWIARCSNRGCQRRRGLAFKYDGTGHHRGICPKRVCSERVYQIALIKRHHDCTDIVTISKGLKSTRVGQDLSMFANNTLRVHTRAQVDRRLQTDGREHRADALVIAAPDPFHPMFAVAALDAGLHVMCEKPLALTVAGCDEIAAARDRSGRVVQVAYMKRYDPAYRRSAGRNFSRLQEAPVLRVPAADDRAFARLAEQLA